MSSDAGPGAPVHRQTLVTFCRRCGYTPWSAWTEADDLIRNGWSCSTVQGTGRPTSYRSTLHGIRRRLARLGSLLARCWADVVAPPLLGPFLRFLDDHMSMCGRGLWSPGSPVARPDGDLALGHRRRLLAAEGVTFLDLPSLNQSLTRFCVTK